MRLLNATAVNVSWDAAVTSHGDSIEYYTVVYGQVAQSHHEQKIIFNSQEQHSAFVVIPDVTTAVAYDFQVLAAFIVNGTKVDSKPSTPVQSVSFGEFILYTMYVTIEIQ